MGRLSSMRRWGSSASMCGSTCKSLRLYGLTCDCARGAERHGLLPASAQREFAAEATWDLPNLAPGATSLLDVTVNGARQGDLTPAALASSTCFIELASTAGKLPVNANCGRL